MPTSKGISNDDKILRDISNLVGQHVIYTEKLDGENTSLLTTHVHARSEDSNHHLSQNWVRNLHAKIAWKIPEQYQIIGENVFAKHSIFYNELTTYFYVFAVVDLKSQYFLSIKETMSICKELELEFVPVLHEGKFDPHFKPPEKSHFGGQAEGFVVRVIDSFAVSESSKCMAKWVRKNHITTTKDWRYNWTPNILKKN